MTVYKFYADWCGPCKALTGLLEMNHLSDKVVPVDIDQDPELASKYGVRSLPTMVRVDSRGDFVSSMVGVKSTEEIKEWLNI